MTGWAEGATAGASFATVLLSGTGDRFHRAMLEAPLGMAITAADGTVRDINDAFAALLHRSPAAMVGRNLREVVHPDDRAVTGHPGASPLHNEQGRLVRPDGTLCWVRIDARGMSNAAASPAHDEHVLVVWDVTESRGAAESLAFRALHDPLTGLANRSLLTDRIERAVLRARRDDTFAAVLFCDLDRFKVLNDSLGHDAGDTVLRVIASRLTECVRNVDTVGRLGGDEFVVICEGLTDPDEARILADRIIASVSDPVPVGESLLHMSTSIGIAVCAPDADATAVALLRDADTAMYRAKSESRGTWAFFDSSLREQAVVRQQLEEDLRRALRNDELFCEYQPVIDVRLGTIRGYEALIRWQHPERGRLAPSAFLPLAEETGLIVGIGVRVIEEACARLAGDSSVEHIAVNVSPTHLGAGDLAGTVRSALDRHGVAPERLVLEITESAVLEGYGPTLRDLGRIHAMGVRLAVDDFGTGYAALSFLRKFPVSMLKLDRSFVAGLPTDDGSARICEAVLSLSKGMGLTVIAEGVETAQQERWLSDRGCDQVQGFRWGKPARWEHLARTLPTVA